MATTVALALPPLPIVSGEPGVCAQIVTAPSCGEKTLPRAVARWSPEVDQGPVDQRPLGSPDSGD